MGKRVSYGVKQLREYVKEKGFCVEDKEVKKYLDGDWDRGFIYTKRSPHEVAIRILEFVKSETKFVVCEGAAGLGWDFDFQALVDSMNGIILGR